MTQRPAFAVAVVDRSRLIPMTGVEAVTRYVGQRVALNQYTATTARSTRILLTAWLRDVRDWEHPSADEVIEWCTSPKSADGKHRRESCLRAFYKHAGRHGWVEERVWMLVPTIRGSSKRPKPIPDEVLARILARASERDRSAILLGRFAGLRAMEIAAAHRDHLDDGMLYTVGKGNKERWVPAHPEVARIISTSRGYVFPSTERPGKPVLAGTMTKWLASVLPPPYTAHTLRHAFCTDFYYATLDLPLTAEVMGHESTRTTERYIKVQQHRAVTAIQGMKIAS